MKVVYPIEWRPKSKWKRRFYAKYMTWLERFGYVIVVAVIGSFIYAFNYKVDELVTADKVKIEAASEVIKVRQPIKVVEILVEDMAEVVAGQPILRYVEGDTAIGEYELWEGAQTLRRLTSDPTDIEWLARYPRPPMMELQSPKAGTLRIDSSQLIGLLSADTELAKVLDYTDLRMSPSLAGQTVAQAEIEDEVRILGITVESEAGILFRGSGSSMSAISGQMLGTEFKDALQKELVGTPLRVRDDRPLQIKEVSDVQVDAQVDLKPATGLENSKQLDPSTSQVLVGKVLSGAHSGTIQLASLPPALAERVYAEVLKNVKGQKVAYMGEQPFTVEDVRVKNVVLKVKAESASASSLDALPAASVSRTYDATIQIQNPPAYLIQAVRRADQQGKAVTAKVELKTGNRPIAFILLKKS